MSQFVRNLFSIHFVALPGVPGQFAPVSSPECQILIFVCNQSQFSCIGRQPLTKLSHISRTFRLTETKLRRVQDTRDDSVTILRENLSREFFEHVQNSSDTRARPCDSREEIENPCERFETFWKLPRECRSQFVANSRSPVRY